MLFINCDGKLIEINIKDYLTDKDYYKEIINTINIDNSGL